MRQHAVHFRRNSKCTKTPFRWRLMWRRWNLKTGTPPETAPSAGWGFTSDIRSILRGAIATHAKALQIRVRKFVLLTSLLFSLQVCTSERNSSVCLAVWNLLHFLLSCLCVLCPKSRCCRHWTVPLHAIGVYELKKFQGAQSFFFVRTVRQNDWFNQFIPCGRSLQHPCETFSWLFQTWIRWGANSGIFVVLSYKFCNYFFSNAT